MGSIFNANKTELVEAVALGPLNARGSLAGGVTRPGLQLAAAQVILGTIRHGDPERTDNSQRQVAC